jgi:hypothetical protein
MLQHMLDEFSLASTKQMRAFLDKMSSVKGQRSAAISRGLCSNI